MADLRIAVELVGQDRLTPVLSGIPRALGGVTDALGKIGLAGMGLRTVADAAQGLGSALGLGLATEMENTRTKFTAFLKDSGKVDEALALIRAEADKTPFTFQAMSSAVASLIPSAKQANVPLLDLTHTAEILAASHPEQGLEGAAFALREAVSGDFQSIIDRFDLPRSTINKLKEQGVPALEAVRQAMAEMGYDMDLVAGLSKTTTGRLSTFQDAIDGIRRTVATPILAALGTQLDRLSAFVAANQDQITALATLLGGALASAVEGAARFVMDAAAAIQQFSAQVRGAWQQLQPVIAVVRENLQPILAGLAAMLAAVVVPAFIAWAAAAASAAAATIAALAPVLLPIAAIGAAVFLLKKGWDEDWGGIQEKTGAVWGWLSANVFAPLGAELGRFTAVVLPELAAAWQNVTAIAQAAWAALVAFLQPALVQLSAQWGETWEAIKLVLTLAWGAIKLEVSVAWEVVQGVILAGLKVLQGDWRGAWDVLREHLGNAWELMKGATAAALQALLEAIVGWAGQAWDAMRTAGLEMVKGILNGLGGLKDELTKTLTDAIAGAIAAAKNAAAGAAAAVGGAVKGAAGAATAAASGGFDWATYNFEKNMGASDEEARKKAGGKGAGPPLLGGDAGVLGGAAVQRGMALLGNQAWDNFCQQFVDDLLSPGVRYPTAWATAQARMTNPGGTLANAPYGSVVWFKPDPTNAFAGHVGFSLGDGRFLSALPTGVAVQNANAYWSSLFAGWGPAYRQLGGPVREGRPYVVGEAGPELFVPQTGGTVVPNDRLRSGTPAIDYDRLASAVLAGFSGARVALDATSGENFVVFHLDGARRRGRL